MAALGNPSRSGFIRVPRPLVLLLLLLGAPGVVQGQEAPPRMTIDEIIDLQRTGMPQPRLLTLVAGACVEGGADPAAQRRLSQEGASEELRRAAFAFACPEIPTPPRVERLEWVGVATTLEEGASQSLRVRALGSGNQELPVPQVRWSVADPSVLEVDGAGTARALRPGNTEVSAEVEGIRTSVSITVTPRVVDLALTPGSVVVLVGDEATVDLQGVSSQGGTIPVQGEWSSMNPRIAEVSGGRIQGRSPGSTSVQVRYGAITRTVPVLVEPLRAARVDVTPERIEFIGTSQPRLLEAAVFASAGQRLSTSPVAWEVEDPSVVWVNEDGMVTPLSPGTTRVFAISDGVRGEVQVRVLRPAINAGGVVVSSLLLPGSGQFQVGRPGRGLLTLAAVGGAGAWGYLTTSVTQLCAAPTPGGQACPPGSVLEETTERPNLIPGIAAAGAVALLSAIDAAMRATGLNRELEQLRAQPWATSAAPSGSGRGLWVGLSLRF